MLIRKLQCESQTIDSAGAKQPCGSGHGIPPYEEPMPWKTTLKRAQEDKREGKAPTTQAGEFVREEMEHIRRGKHGARSARQAIAIGLSKARRAGVDLKPPKKGRATEKTRKSAERDYRKGHGSKKTSSPARSRSRLKALKREPRGAASHSALSRQARSAAQRRKRSESATTGAGRRQRKAA